MIALFRLKVRVARLLYFCAVYILYFSLSLSSSLLPSSARAAEPGKPCSRATAFFSPAPGSYLFIADDWNVYSLDAWDPRHADIKNFRTLTRATPPMEATTPIAFHPIGSNLDSASFFAIGANHRLYNLARGGDLWKEVKLPDPLQSLLRKNGSGLTGLVISSFAYVFQDSRGNIYRSAPSQIQPTAKRNGQMPDFITMDEIAAPEGAFNQFSLAEHRDGLFSLATNSGPGDAALFVLSSGRTSDGTLSYQWKKVLSLRSQSTTQNSPRFSGISIYSMDPESIQQAQASNLASPLATKLYGVLGFQKEWFDPYLSRTTHSGIFFYTNASEGTFQSTGPTADLKCTPKSERVVQAEPRVRAGQ